MLSSLRRVLQPEIRRMSRRLPSSRAIVTSASSSNAADADSTLPDTVILPHAPLQRASQTPSSYLDLPDHQIVLNIPPEEDPLLHYLASSLMQSGKRHAAQRRVRRMLMHLHAFTRAEPLPLLRRSIELAAPSVRVITHRSGGKNTSIPVALNEKQRVRHAVQAILKASNSKPGLTIEERLAREIVAVLSQDSNALKEKETVHRFAMVNRGNIKEPRSS